MSKRLFSPLKRKEPWDAEAFSLNLLEKEIEVEKSFRIENIEDLITMYSHAIEHYNELNDPKYYDYQDRLHKFLLKPEVSSMMSGQKKPNLYNMTKHKSLSSSQIAKSRLLESNRSVIKNKFSEPPMSPVHKAQIIQNISSQDSNLEDRVSRRRSQKILSMSNINDISTKASYYLDEREQMEFIMERYYSEKAKEIEDITLKYLLQMESVAPTQKAHLAQEMSKEIIKISQKHDDLRIQELKKLKDSTKRAN